MGRAGAQVPVLCRGIGGDLAANASNGTVAPVVGAVICVPFVANRACFAFVGSCVFVRDVSVAAEDAYRVDYGLLNLAFVLYRWTGDGARFRKVDGLNPFDDVAAVSGVLFQFRGRLAQDGEDGYDVRFVRPWIVGTFRAVGV